MIYLVHNFYVSSVKNDLDDLDRDLSYSRCDKTQNVFTFQDRVLGAS